MEARDVNNFPDHGSGIEDGFQNIKNRETGTGSEVEPNGPWTAHRLNGILNVRGVSEVTLLILYDS